MVIGRRWAAHGCPRSRRRRCARAEVQRGAWAPTSINSVPRKSWTSETNPRIPGRDPEPKTPRPGAHARRPNSFDVGVEDAAPRAPMRGSSSEMADHALLRPPERHARAARVRSGSRPVRLNEVAAVDGPQARKPKSFLERTLTRPKKIGGLSTHGMSAAPRRPRRWGRLLTPSARGTLPAWAALA